MNNMVEMSREIPLALPIIDAPLPTAEAATFLVVSTVLATVSIRIKIE